MGLTLKAALLFGAAPPAAPALAQDDRDVVGFATAQSGVMQGYDDAAIPAGQIRIAAHTAAGGLLDQLGRVRLPDVPKWIDLAEY